MMELKKELKAGAKNPLTTAVGMVLAGLYALNEIQNGRLNFENWESWAIPVAIAVLSYFMRDAGKSSEDSGIKNG